MEANHLPDWIQQQRFVSTHWSAIEACAGVGETSQIAREALCRDYWYPVYAHVKRSGLHHGDVEDVTQDFFLDILNRPWFSRADKTRGKFRSFLLATLNNFLHDRHDRRRASKRSGAYEHIPLNLSSAELRYPPQGAGANTSPETTYEIEWAITVVEVALKRLEAEYGTASKQVVFRQLKAFLTVEGEGKSYEVVAATLATSVGGVKAAVHRLRKRYGAILREEVARTVGAPEDVEDEMLHMRTLLATV